VSRGSQLAAEGGPNRCRPTYPGRLFPRLGRQQRVRDHSLSVDREGPESLPAATTQMRTMKKNKTSKNPTPRKNSRKIGQKFPPGWNERKVRAVIQHYDQLTD